MGPNAADAVDAFVNIIENGPAGIVESAADIATCGITVRLKSAEFSTVWKTFSRFFHTMERMFPHCGKDGPFFHAMDFPYNGKTFSTVWKTRISGCFRGGSGCSPGLWSGARGAPCEP